MVTPYPELQIERKRAFLITAARGLDGAVNQTVQQRALRVERQRLTPETLYSAIRMQKARVEGLGAHLEAVSPQAVLRRGYALVQDANGRPVTRADARPPNGRVVLSFADGERGARLDPLTSQGDLGL